MLTLRARFVDDLATEMKAQLQQIVVLGSGFDTMAFVYVIKDAKNLSCPRRILSEIQMAQRASLQFVTL